MFRGNKNDESCVVAPGDNFLRIKIPATCAVELQQNKAEDLVGEVKAASPPVDAAMQSKKKKARQMRLAFFMPESKEGII
ncbi:MAG TPA: hypothetical protein VL197_01080 [Nitrospirota bacterium]|nr:hypothetical protein [Nitrospirota bacterium]